MTAGPPRRLNGRTQAGCSRSAISGGAQALARSWRSGYRGEQEPFAFWLAERQLAVRAVVDRWFAPTQRWFKVDADDGNMYVLRHDEASGGWELAAYMGAAR